MPKEIFRITSAGSVDDGKSTILARLLLDTGSIYDDQLAKNYDPNKIADLLDGLESEQSQGITIDVAHRFFDSKTRRYQLADSPGHEQYTRNMATACAGSDALLLVIDAREGLKPQTKHHLEIALRLGIKQIVFAVNKMDLVNFSQKRFNSVHEEIENHIIQRSSHFSNTLHSTVPVSGLKGSNIVKSSERLSWFAGKTLLKTLDGLRKPVAIDKDVIFRVQYIQRVPAGGRRYLGRLYSGHVEVGQTLYAANMEVKVAGLLASGEESTKAETNQAVSITLDREIDLQIGDMLSTQKFATHDQYEIDLIWLGANKGLRGVSYLLNAASDSATVTLTKISKIDLVSNLKTGEISDLSGNDIARCNISLSKTMPLESFSKHAELGKFTLVDRISGQTVAVATVNYPLRRSENIKKHALEITPEMHAQVTGNRPRVIWFTGLSGSGKSTIANSLSVELYSQGKPSFVLDGDNLRFGINRDLGFTESDRTENIRRTAEIAALMADAGIVVLVALVSPFERDRLMAKEIIGPERFRLVHVNTPLDVCEKRDPKGLYKKARRGQIPNFTGINSEFEPPVSWDLQCLSYDRLELAKLID